MRRPLLFILGVWIVGELAVGWLGISLVPATSLDSVMAEAESSVPVRVAGTVEKISRTGYGYS